MIRSQQGSLLIDALVGVGIIASGLFTVWLSLATITEFSIRDSELATAQGILQRELETARGTEFDLLDDATTTTTTAALPSGTLTSTISSVGADLKELSFAVSWQNRTGSRQATAVTRVARGGIGGN